MFGQMLAGELVLEALNQIPAQGIFDMSGDDVDVGQADRIHRDHLSPVEQVAQDMEDLE